MDNISVTIITKNEESNIKKCLESVKWADEIILLDQYSTDNTVKIAKDYGVKIFQETWKGYALQKNSAVDKAKGPWILSIDADERVTADLQEEIVSIIKLDSAKEGYSIPRKNYFCGKWIKHSGWYPDFSLRFFKKHSGSFEERSVHEKVVINGETGTLKNPIHHFTYISTADYISRMERYSRLAAIEISGKKYLFWPFTLTLRPLVTFFSMYFLQRGFLDGISGFFLAASYSYYTFLKYYRYYSKNF